MEYDDFIILLIIWFHFIGDNMTESFVTLLTGKEPKLNIIQHSFIYAFPLALIGFWFFVANWFLHVLIDMGSDYITTTVKDHVFDHQWPHICKILRGMDHMIHLTILIGSYFMLHHFDLLGLRVF